MTESRPLSGVREPRCGTRRGYPEHRTRLSAAGLSSAVSLLEVRDSITRQCLLKSGESLLIAGNDLDHLVGQPDVRVPVAVKQEALPVKGQDQVHEVDQPRLILHRFAERQARCGKQDS